MSFNPNSVDFVVPAVIENGRLKLRAKTIHLQYWPEGPLPPQKPISIVNIFRENGVDKIARDIRWWTIEDAGTPDEAARPRIRLAKLTFHGAEFTKTQSLPIDRDGLKPDAEELKRESARPGSSREHALREAFIARDTIQLYVALGTIVPPPKGCEEPPVYIANLFLRLDYSQSERLY